MRGILLGLLSTAACYGPTVPSNVPCSPTGECPQGQFCVDQVCLTSPGSDASGLDSDGDGFADDRDNCPGVANADQLDEDGDHRGDACDSCPQVSDTGQDGDGDGIADVCDPNPMAAVHDTRWLFEGFHGGLPAIWTVSPHWLPAGDGDTIRANGGVNMDEYIDVPLSSSGRTYGNFTMSAGFTIEDALGTDGPAIGFDIFDNSNNKTLDCSLFQNAGNAGDRRLGLFDSFQLDSEPAFAWQIGVPYTLTLAVHGNSFTCSTVGPNGHATATGTSTIVARDGGAVSLGLYSMTVRVDWLFVAGTP